MQQFTECWVSTYTKVFVKVPGPYGPEPIECEVYTEVRHVDSWDALVEVLNLSELHRRVVGNALAASACSNSSDYGSDAERPSDRMFPHWGVWVDFKDPQRTVGDNDFPDNYIPGTEDYPRFGPYREV